MKTQRILCFVVLLFSAANASGEDLLQIYQDAARFDPIFKAAEATWHAAQENISIAHAAYLPRITLEANASRVRTQPELTPRSNTYTSPYSYGIAIQQPLLHVGAWSAIQAAKVGVKQAQALFLAARQNLLMRVSERYFEVLRASDALKFLALEKKSIRRQLTRAHERYKVGLSPITSYYEAKARYDAIVAQEFTAGNTLRNAVETLHEITGVVYQQLAGVQPQLKLRQPEPKDIQTWVRTALKQNSPLLAARYAVLAARVAVKSSAAERYPSLSILANYQTNKGLGLSDISNGANGVEQASVSLHLNFPVYQGGSISARTRQSLFNYEKAALSLEAQRRRIISEVRQRYRNILAGIHTIKADRQAILSSQSALSANEAGYKVGTRTVLDVLGSQSALYQAKRKEANDVYDYLLNTLRLRLSTAQLALEDIRSINHYLTVDTSLRELSKP